MDLRPRACCSSRLPFRSFGGLWKQGSLSMSFAVRRISSDGVVATIGVNPGLRTIQGTG